jgi:6-phosphogluconate dehydrogenase (decarboxylating)
MGNTVEDVRGSAMMARVIYQRHCELFRSRGRDDFADKLLLAVPYKSGGHEETP